TAHGARVFANFADLAELSLWGTKAADYIRPKKVRPPVALDTLKPADPEGITARAKDRFTVDEQPESRPIVTVMVGNAKLSDLAPADLGELKTLRALNVGFGTEITDAGLHYLKDLTNLEELYLGGARVEGDGLALLAGLKKLKKLYLPYGDFTARHLAPLA